ncbi:MAG: electron transfer flavoprotein subunit alpha/FixB family protein [Acidobacteria bacterium]|nr:electron transfer flavoprotein subunit alpha/FixB family protein [Acidobacteriota bacterium]
MSVLVVAELTHAGDFHPMSWEALTAGRELAGQLGLPLSCLVIGGSLGDRSAEAAARGVTQVAAVEHALLSAYTADGFCSALTQALGQIAPQYVVFPHTYQVRDYGPKLATAVGRAFLSDCTSIRFDGAEPIFVKQVFQGKLSADFTLAGDAPRLFSVQSGAFAADAERPDSPAPIHALAIELDEAAIRVHPTEPYREAAGTADLSSAERIVSIGRGIKDPENIALAQRLADALGAELAASRPICDSGWLPLDRQVGSSGQTVKPKLYLALGISGAIQHLVGMKGSEVIAAINTDASAPIFEVADYGVVGDLFEVVPELLKQLEQS